MKKHKIIRSTTVPMSLDLFCYGMLRELNKKYSVMALSSPGPVLDLIAEREGVPVVGIKMESGLSFFSDLCSLFAIVRLFIKERPQMVHSITPKAGLLCMLAAWIARVPVRVHTVTGLFSNAKAEGFKRKQLRWADMLTCACATHVIPEGHGVRNDLVDRKLTSKTLKVLGNGNVRGIDLEKYDRTPEVMAQAADIIQPDTVTFVSVGRLVGDKGINELVDAFMLLYKRFPNTRLVLVGWTEEEFDPLRTETLLALAECPGILPVGYQNDVRPWLAAADVAVLASYHEGFPNVVIEAGAMGLPQIVTDVNGAREIIVEGENGTIIQPRSAVALYDAMQRMLDPDYRAKLAKNAREMIASRYEQTYVRHCLYEFYDQIL